MTKTNLLIGLAFSFLFITSCTKKEIIEEEEEETISEQMDLENLKVGDRFLYAYLIGDTYFDDENFDFEYSADTLEITVIDFVDGKYHVRERILPTSTIFETGEKYLDKDSIYTNQWYIANESLMISSFADLRVSSHLLNYYSYLNQIVFPLEDFEGEEVQLKGWKTEMAYIEDIRDAYTTSFELLGNEYERLNVMIRNTAMAFDGDGWTIIYNKNKGFARVISYSAWTGMGWGWDKI